MPGPQGALVPDQGGSSRCGDERVRHAERARRGQPEDDPGTGAQRAAHGAKARLRREYLGYDGQLRCAASGTQHVVEYQEETRSHNALTYDHSGAIGTWAPSALPPGQALRQPAPLFKKLDESVIAEEYARLRR